MGCRPPVGGGKGKKKTGAEMWKYGLLKGAMDSPSGARHSKKMVDLLSSCSTEKKRRRDRRKAGWIRHGGEGDTFLFGGGSTQGGFEGGEWALWSS